MTNDHMTNDHIGIDQHLGRRRRGLSEVNLAEELHGHQVGPSSGDGPVAIVPSTRGRREEEEEEEVIESPGAQKLEGAGVTYRSNS
jgi:hypothetical protein